jgi:uncharacterized protein (TIGR00369 family)
MSADWLNALPATVHGMPVQRPAVTDVAMPEGYTEALPLIDPFEAYAFQTFRRTNADGSTTYALPTDARHDNSSGVVHGGVLMTFADSALAYTAWALSPEGAWVVTVSQSSSFLRAVRPGDLVEVTPVITRSTRTMIFTRGDFLVRGEAVFQASSIWKITGK